MKESLNKLFLEYQKTQNEYIQAMLPGNTLPNWNAKRLAVYSYGVVIGKYIEKDEETLNVINQTICEEEIKRTIKSCYNYDIDKLSSLDTGNLISELKIKSNQDALRDLESLDLEEWIKKYYIFTLDHVKIPIDSCLGFIYIDYSYKEYERKINSPYSLDQDNILKLYQDNNNEGTSLSKYGLISIDENKELICVDPPRIYDKEIDKTLFLKNVPHSISKVLQDLKDENLIGKISIRVSNNKIFDGKHIFQKLYEEVERGKIFSLTNINEHDVTKLYSGCFQDCLWVIIDENNITFEELCEDFEVYEDMIVTQVVHLQYKNTINGLVITHLDHEYIFYNEDEYQERCNNPRQKGNAAKRIKSFKIDETCIPFIKSCTVKSKEIESEKSKEIEIPFIYFILDNYFKHKDLLREYFEKIM